ncbi:SpaH/EbpB family LPXTG-anchored major pilin [Lacticaseibacillus suibinensis]|uniref:SpaH/EbpB family LPXTG-anchored major pilin n=1 Tax=Lacticaseibacillus suibinensis TaxID=2486011 RepID=UPI000F793289|nr:SpaH/EbpB family LPXTG-anchored major pilin [Lacticaseibacillus suibinensis]
MKMTMNKVSRAALAGLMVCGLTLSAAPALNAAPETVRATAVSPTLPDKVTVEINKKLLKSNYQLTPNTGETIADLEALEGIGNVEFSAYDVTSIFYDLQAANPGVSAEDLTKEIVADWSEKYKASAPVKGSGTTDPVDGTLEFKDLETRTTNGKYKLYLFEEGNSDRTDILRSVPMIVGMPVRNAANTGFLKTIKIYPKNTGLEKELTNPNENTTDGKVYNYEVGQNLEYETNLVIPHGIRDAGSKITSINLTDVMSAVGTTLDGVPSITVEGEDEELHDLFVAAGTYTDSNDDDWENHAGFKYEIDLEKGSKESEIIALLNKIEGKALSIKYTMKINKHAVPNQDIGNTFTGEFGNGPELTVVDESQKVETSGHKFTKYDAYDENRGLPDAEFKLQNNDGKWAILNNPGGEDGTYKPESIRWGTKAEATILKSAAKGHLQINGLESGKYTLVETKAPTGYKITTEDTNFTVAKGVLTTTALGSDTIANTPLDGELPLTGGMGIAAFLIVGTAAMGTAVIYKKRHA